MGASDAPGNNVAVDANLAGKQKRVRTGCLTCRERHLKCDEGLPNCQNCRKSSRTCRRGIRLNFMYIDCREPPTLLRSNDWEVRFEDNSREIASEYRGGLKRYGSGDRNVRSSSSIDTTPSHDFPADVSGNSQRSLPSIQGVVVPDTFTDDSQTIAPPSRRDSYHQHSGSHSDSGYGSSNLPLTSASSYTNADSPASPSKGPRTVLTNPDEVLYLQIFIEEVGLWMDSMDPDKHFSRLLPFHSLGEPMLLNAFLACGARQLAGVNPKHSESRALHYYDTATRYLLAALQNTERNTVVCATTAVILNVYEIMCERALQRMNHIAGARALIKECGWNAKSTGIGAACFWLNVGMELLSCLHFNWQVAWDPDDWGVDMNFDKEALDQREEKWTYRIIYITGKIANFRAAASVQMHERSPRSEEFRLQHRYAEWRHLRHLADTWDSCVPRTMHPLAYLEPEQTSSGSAFPEVYLIKRVTIVARLFYHTAMVLLAQVNPNLRSELKDMQQMQKTHSNLICGIVAHTKDRGVASVAIRSLAIAAECLTDRRSQEEVLSIFDRIQKHTGWRVDFVHKELPTKWGWTEPLSADVSRSMPAASHLTTVPMTQPSSQYGNHNSIQAAQQYAMQGRSDSITTPTSLQSFTPLAPVAPRSHSHAHSQPQSMGSPAQMPLSTHKQQTTHHHHNNQMSQQQAPPQRRTIPVGIPNPLLSNADFGLPSHPYQSHYVAPSVQNVASGLHLDSNSLGSHAATQTSLDSMQGFTY